MNTGQKNKQVVLDAYAALNAGDAAGYFGRMSDEVKLTYYGSHRFSRTYQGKQDIMTNFVAPLRATLDGSLKLHVTNILGEGDQVVVEAKGEARTKGGLDYNNIYCIVIKLNNGKMAEIREYMDTDLTKQVFG